MIGAGCGMGEICNAARALHAEQCAVTNYELAGRTTIFGASAQLKAASLQLGVPDQQSQGILLCGRVVRRQ